MQQTANEKNTNLSSILWPVTSYLKKTHPSEMNKTCRTLLEKQRQTHKGHFSKDIYTWTCQLCEDTGSSFDRDRWKESKKFVLAVRIDDDMV